MGKESVAFAPIFNIFFVYGMIRIFFIACKWNEIKTCLFVLSLVFSHPPKCSYLFSPSSPPLVSQRAETTPHQPCISKVTDSRCSNFLMFTFLTWSSHHSRQNSVIYQYQNYLFSFPSFVSQRHYSRERLLFVFRLSLYQDSIVVIAPRVILEISYTICASHEKKFLYRLHCLYS